MRFYFIGILLVFMGYAAKAQDLIRGMVVDSASFNPLPYVNVHIKSTFRGTTTDARGNFAIAATSRDTLIFTLVGYERLVFPLQDYETGMIRMTQQSVMLTPIIINDSRLNENPYEGMFDEQNEKSKQRIPFYYSRVKKDKLKAAHWRDEALQAQTYVDVIVGNPETKSGLMKKYSLTEKQYYEILTQFNEKHYTVMYYLTAGELLSLLNRFFEAHAPH